MNPLIPAIISSVISSTSPQEVLGPEMPQATRALSQDAVSAVMYPPAQGYARFGDKTLHLAPGLQIRNTGNRIVMSGILQEPVAVRYEVDGNGDVIRVWILTPAEAAHSDSAKQ